MAAATDLSMGTTLSQKDLVLAEWYNDSPPAGAFTKTNDVVGHPLLYPMSARQPILQKDLGVQGAGIGLAGKLPEGMRAVSIRDNDIMGVAGFVYPGSHVDLLMTFTPPGFTGSPVTETVMQNVEVLSAGQTIEPDPQGRPQSVGVVTLLLNAQDAQKLQLASGQGNIQFVLRNGADQKIADLRPTRFDELLVGQKPPAPVVAAPGVKHTPRKAAPASPIYVLEVIQGTQRTTQKF